jgi:hypothetical protein
MYLVIGSQALKHHFPQTREPKDFDVFTEVSGLPVEAFWDERLLDYWTPGAIRFATVDELYTIKVSHSHWDLRNGTWGKHMADILFLQDHAARLLPELYKILYSIWIDKHGPKKMVFSESEEFFDDAVVRKYDHDSLHESVAYGDHALYLDYLSPGRSVAMDMAKVWSSDFSTIVKLFREEIYATALERIVVPSGYRCSPGFAYHWALRRTITSLTKGRSSLWLIENFEWFMDAKDPFTEENYVERHLRKQDKLIPLGV